MFRQISEASRTSPASSPPNSDSAKTIASPNSRSCASSSGDVDDGTDGFLCAKEIVINRTRLLLGCYRKGDAQDPEIYTRAVISVLARYPEQVVIAVTEPATGIPARLKWLPAIAELVDACEQEMEPIYRERAREAERRRTAAAIADMRPDQISQEERDRVSAGLSALVEKLRGAPDRIAELQAAIRDEKARKAGDRQSERERADAWNREVEVGSEVIMIREDGTLIDTLTRTCAVFLGERGAVLWLDCIAGAVPLDRVRRRGAGEEGRS